MISAYHFWDSSQVLETGTHSYPYVKAIWYTAVATVCSLRVINNIVNRTPHIRDLSIGCGSAFFLQEGHSLASASTSLLCRQLDDAPQYCKVYTALLTLTFQAASLIGLDNTRNN